MSSSLLEWQSMHEEISLSQIEDNIADLNGHIFLSILDSDNCIKEIASENIDNDDERTIIDEPLSQQNGWEDIFCSQATVASIPPIKIEDHPDGFVPNISTNPFSRGMSTQSYLLDNLATYMWENEQVPSNSSNSGSHSYLTRKRSIRSVADQEVPSLKRIRREDSFLSFCQIPLMIKPDPDAPTTTTTKIFPFTSKYAVSAGTFTESQENPMGGILGMSQGDAECSQLVLDRGAPTLLPALALQRCFYKLPKQYGLAQRLQQRNRLIPTLRQVRKLCGYLDFVQVHALNEICDPDSTAHQSIHNVLISQRMAQSSSRLISQRSSKKWMTSLHEVIPPHNFRDHKAERITRQAASMLLATSILAHHKGLNLPLPEDVHISNISMYTVCMDKFLMQNQAFLADDRKTAIRDALPRLFFFFIELFSILPLKGNLEVCLLLLSFLEGEGKHHQRGGTNADITYKFYRDFLEFIDISVMPQLRRSGSH